MLNARRRTRGGKLTVSKEHDYSSRKIDACVAAILAWRRGSTRSEQGVTAPDAECTGLADWVDPAGVRRVIDASSPAGALLRRWQRTSVIVGRI